MKQSQYLKNHWATKGKEKSQENNNIKCSMLIWNVM